MNRVVRMELGQLDELGRMETPVHRLDARAKALVTFAFIVTVMSFPRHAIAPLTPFVLYPVALLSLGHIPASFLTRKLLVAAPFALIVGVFNPILDRQPILSFGSLTISGGWLSYASLMLRFVLTVSAALALAACTGMNRLAAAMERLGVPRVFVVQLLFLYRYLFVIADQGMMMMRSARLRGSGRALPPRVYGPMVGHLLLRAMERAERVHRAMVARGFDGNVRILNPTQFRWPDAVFVGGSLLFFAAARRWNLAADLGRLLAGGVS